MAREGMDVDVVIQHGTALKNIGDNDLTALIVRVDNIVNEIQSTWWGPDAQAFHGHWTSTNKPCLTGIAGAISTYGQQALVNAQAQKEKSASAGTL